MLQLRPIFYVIGFLVCALGAAMLAPALADLYMGAPEWRIFLYSFALAEFIGLGMIFIGRGARQPGLSVQQTFMLTTLTWLTLPTIGALPFFFGEAQGNFTNAFFESMSGLTTTGSTVFSGLELAPRGFLLWRALLQWFGGVGIIVMAIAFLPEMQVGGMQLFRSESFDTFGKILPRAAEIASSIAWIYVGLTLICFFVYTACGMSPFDALCHAMTTIATGGFANVDTSFANMGASAEYSASLFMILASLPFVRYVQLVRGAAQPLWRDAQVRAFFLVAFGVVLTLTLWRYLEHGGGETGFRESLFNGVSILTGTGYASANYNSWGPFPVMIFFLIGLIGGCAGSTCCSVKIFRFQVLVAATRAELKRIYWPSAVFTPRYEGRPLEEEVISSVMAFFMFFFVTIALLALTLGLMGEDFITSLSGAATAVANVGPGLGDKIGPSGNFMGLSDGAKWLLAMGMLLGRLELFSVLAMLTPAFWRG